MLPFGTAADSQPAGSVPPPIDAGESRQPKPKTLPCKYCSKHFRRVEHVQRHERTHTKEKPFSCGWDRCGKTFGRRDLLVRHEKLVHLNEANKEGQKPQKGATSHRLSSSEGKIEHDAAHGSRRATQQGLHQLEQPQSLHQPRPYAPHFPPHHPQVVHPPQHRTHHQSPSQQQQQQQFPHDAISGNGPPRAGAGNLDLLSDAALASEVNNMPAMSSDVEHQFQMQQQHQQQQHHPPAAVAATGALSQHHLSQHHTNHERLKSYGGPMAGYQERPREEAQPTQPGLPQQATHGGFDDYNMFLDGFNTSPHLLPPPFEPEQQLNVWQRSQSTGTLQRPGGLKQSTQFSSRYGTVVSDPREAEEQARGASLRISVGDHSTMKLKVEAFSTILPNDFVFPSRHTLMRFLEGYMSGFNDHLPFLHLPTLSPAELAPELLLAIVAVGAQYRFESNRGHSLWFAARAVAMEQIRRRQSSEMHALLPSGSAYSPNSTRPSPSTLFKHPAQSAPSERLDTQAKQNKPHATSNTAKARLETTQAVLLLFASGLWAVKPILGSALSLQSQLASLIREEGLDATTNHVNVTDWEAWIRLEGAARTKLIAYCFFNLCSTAYNMAPLLLTSEMNLYLPARSRLWRAESAWQWHELRQSTPPVEGTVHQAFTRLFGQNAQAVPSPSSSLGSYILINALSQHIYLLKQTSLTSGSGYEMQRTLKPEDVEEVTQALRVWQLGFEQRHQMRVADTSQCGSLDTVQGGSLSHNTTALLRLAHIRLYADVSPSRSLETRDCVLIASSLGVTPLHRSLRLHRAIFQAIHALSMLVKIGVNYVARTKTTEWSMQHSLCNFECAILLAKWLMTLAAITSAEPPVSSEEKNLLEMVRQMLDETEFAVPLDAGSLSGAGSQGAVPADMLTNDSVKLQQMASAVVRLWAETFKGPHIFDLVRVLGSSLECYADVLEKTQDR